MSCLKCVRCSSWSICLYYDSTLCDMRACEVFSVRLWSVHSSLLLSFNEYGGSLALLLGRGRCADSPQPIINMICMLTVSRYFHLHYFSAKFCGLLLGGSGLRPAAKKYELIWRRDFSQSVCSVAACSCIRLGFFLSLYSGLVLSRMCSPGHMRLRQPTSPYSRTISEVLTTPCI